VPALSHFRVGSRTQGTPVVQACASPFPARSKITSWLAVQLPLKTTSSLLNASPVVASIKRTRLSRRFRQTSRANGLNRNQPGKATNLRGCGWPFPGDSVLNRLAQRAMTNPLPP